MTATSRSFFHSHLQGYLPVILIALASLAVSGHAQDRGNELRARLSPMPATAITVRTITGVGEVNASLRGDVLTVTGRFEGMSSAATMAHIHRGPKAQPGPVALTLDVDKSAAGTVSGALTLTPELIEALHSEGLYVQIHSENNPTGELRGWLLH